MYFTKKYLILLATVLLNSNLLAQPFQIGQTTITFIDASRNNRSIPTEVYYPADVAGNNVPVTMTTPGKIPVISFGHGFVMTWSAYQNIWDALVPEGFIIAFPKTEGGLAPSHLEFGKDIAFILSELTILGQDTSSLFFNRVDTMNCVMGHSMGGGAAFLAAQFSPAVKTLATLAPAETNPSAIQAAASLSIPSLVIAGGNDCVTPPPAHQIPLYDSLQSNCKTYISILGGSHCQMAENNFFCSLGEATCTPPPTIARAEQHVIINRYLLPWLKFELKNDCLSGAQFDSLITSDTSITYQKTCTLCSITSVNENANNFNIEIFPNPFHDKIFIQLHTQEVSNVSIDMYLMNGRILFSKTFENVAQNEQLRMDVKEDLSAGIYFLKATVNGKYFIRKILKQ